MVAFPASDAAKVALLLGAFAGIYGLSRWASRQTESVPPTPADPPEPARPPALDPPRPWSKVVSIDAGPQFAKPEILDETALLPVRIVNMYFSRFDIVPGPPDPQSFADELFVDLY